MNRKNFNAKLRTLFILTLALPLSFISCSVENEETVGGTTGGSKDQIIISEQYFPLEDYEYSVQNAKVDDGVYTLSFENENPNIVNGSVIQIDMDTVVQLVRVISIEGSGENVTIKTEPADLGDIFINGSFTLSTEGMSSAKTRNTIPNSNVFYPTSLTYFDENNEKHTVEFIDGTRGGFDKRLYSKFIDYSGYTIAETEHTRTYLETCTFDFNLDLVMSYNFEELKEGYKKYRRGELVMNKSDIKGDLNTDLMVRFDAKAKTEQKLDEVCIKPNIHKPIIAKFMVGPVPVVVVMNTSLYIEGSYEAEGEFSAYTGFATETDVELGFSWKQGSDLKPYADFNFKPKWHKPTVEGSAHLENKICVFPRINFSVYGLLGPAFDIKPYVRQTLDLGMYDMMGSNNKDFYGATYNMFTGYDAAVALTLMPTMNTETIAKSPSWNVLEKNIYQGPSKLEYVGEKYEEVKPRKTYKIDFSVMDNNILFRKDDFPILPWVVKFVTNCGKFSSDFTMADCSTGLATVNWTPSGKTVDGKDPYVVAIIHDNVGKEILANRFITKLSEDSLILCPDDNHPHAIDLGLPSGTKWSCCNVGATSPLEYGGYYAWGETEEKNEYNLLNYKYFFNDEENYNKMTWIFIGDNISSSSYDVAHVKWKAPWCMPTISEFVELVENCNWEWININGISGLVLSGNENSIFIPASGLKLESRIINLNYSCMYWSASDVSSCQDTQGSSNACVLSYNYIRINDDNIADMVVHSGFCKEYGLSVRPIKK